MNICLPCTKAESRILNSVQQGAWFERDGRYIRIGDGPLSTVYRVTLSLLTRMMDEKLVVWHSPERPELGHKATKFKGKWYA